MTVSTATADVRSREPVTGAEILPVENAGVTAVETCAVSTSHSRHPRRFGWAATHVRIASCRKCRRPFRDGEPVTWRLVNSGYVLGRRVRWCDYVCSDCAGPREDGGTFGTVWTSRRCESCGRRCWRSSDRYGSGWARTKHTFCSGVCEAAYYRQARLAEAAVARVKACASCGEVFAATRADALFCSARCRQRAHRCRA